VEDVGAAGCKHGHHHHHHVTQSSHSINAIGPAPLAASMVWDAMPASATAMHD
jgi:hypothetical protein